MIRKRPFSFSAEPHAAPSRPASTTNSAASSPRTTRSFGLFDGTLDVDWDAEPLIPPDESGEDEPPRTAPPPLRPQAGVRGPDVPAAAPPHTRPPLRIDFLPNLDGNAAPLIPPDSPPRHVPAQDRAPAIAPPSRRVDTRYPDLTPEETHGALQRMRIALPEGVHPFLRTYRNCQTRNDLLNCQTMGEMVDAVQRESSRRTTESLAYMARKASSDNLPHIARLLATLSLISGGTPRPQRISSTELRNLLRPSQGLHPAFEPWRGSFQQRWNEQGLSGPRGEMAAVVSELLAPARRGAPNIPTDAT